MSDPDFQFPPADAWGALFEHLRSEVASGRETEESAKALIRSAQCNDFAVTSYRLLNLKPPPWIDDLMQELVKLVMREAIEDVLRNDQKNKTPFWAKKWRGQR